MKEDKRFDKIEVAFGEMKLDKNNFLQAIAGAMYRGMCDFSPRICPKPNKENVNDNKKERQ